MIKMNEGKKIELGMFLAMVLRHTPEVIGVEMDEHGWVDVDELIAGMCDVGKRIDRETLDDIVATDNKQRYAYSDDGRLIRANQGHSIPVDLELDPIKPPDVLYHGTATRFLGSIYEQGLLPMSRIYVHLSPDEDTAAIVGERHGDIAILRVDAAKMFEEGHDFFLSRNGVWLTDAVPPEFFERVR